jgi:hypothetical protein
MPIQICARCSTHQLILQAARVRPIWNPLNESNDVDGERMRPLLHVLTPLIHGDA